MSGQPGIHYIGLFQSPTSWAKVNRELVLALDELNISVTVSPQKGFLYDKHFDITPDLEDIRERSGRNAVEVAMQYPENLWKLSGTRNAAWVLYETTLPDTWRNHIRDHADVYLCPSDFVRDRAIESGLSPDRCVRVPFGVNMDLYSPGEKEQNAFGGEDPFRFLHVGPPHKRKGARELIRAFSRAFQVEDPVELYLKSFSPTSRSDPESWEFVFERIQNGAVQDRPDIFLDQSHRSETEMVELYRSSNVLVLPSYGEAFGLSVLESFATGTPVIGSHYGPLTELIHPRRGWFINGSVQQMQGIAYDSREEHPFFQPDVHTLSRIMESVADSPSECRKRGEKSREFALSNGWKRSAKQLVHVLFEEGNP